MYGFYSCRYVQEEQVFIVYIYISYILFVFLRIGAQEKDAARALLTLLLIGKYRNARNIEHLDGTSSVAPPQRSSCRNEEVAVRGGVERVGGC